MPQSSVYDSASKIFVYKADYPAVLDGAAEYLYEFAVAHGVKEAFKVEVNYMKPFRGPNRHLSFGYEIRVSGDTLYSYLPYFGAAYNVPYGGGKGLNWDAPLTGYQVSAGRKGATIVEMTAYNGEDYFLYSLELMPNGTAYLNVRSRDREPISFSGDMDLRTD